MNKFCADGTEEKCHTGQLMSIFSSHSNHSTSTHNLNVQTAQHARFIYRINSCQNKHSPETDGMYYHILMPIDV